MPQTGRGGPPRISPLSVGLQWATAITTIGFEIAIPTLGGWWLDGYFGTSPVLTVILALLGMFVAMRHLWDIAKRLGAGNTRPAPPAAREPDSTP